MGTGNEAKETLQAMITTYQCFLFLAITSLSPAPLKNTIMMACQKGFLSPCTYGSGDSFFLLWQTDSYHECSQCVSWKKRLIRKLFNENWKHFHFQTLDDIETPQLVEATQCTCSVKLQSVYILLVLYTCVFMFVCSPTLFSVLSNQFCTTQSVIWWVIDVILVR